MDPKRAEEIRAAIDAQVGPLNLYALQCYAGLLVRCGVVRLRVFREFILM